MCLRKLLWKQTDRQRHRLTEVIKPFQLFMNMLKFQLFSSDGILLNTFNREKINE